MKICETCGKDYKCIDDIYVCENGHTSEYQIETVEGDTTGRRASKTIKTYNKNEKATPFELLTLRFNTWKYYKKKHNLSSKIMKIYLKNIKFRSKSLGHNKKLANRSLFIAIIYLTFRMKKEKNGTYFFGDFLKDIDDINDIRKSVQKQLGLFNMGPMGWFSKPIEPGFFTRQLSHLKSDHKHNNYIYEILEEKFILWIKSFIRIIKDFKEIYDFSKELTLERKTCNFTEKFILLELLNIEQLLTIEKKGIENTPLLTRDDLLKITGEDKRFPNLYERNFIVEIFPNETQTIEQNYIHSFIGELHNCKFRRKIDNNITTLFLKFIFLHYHKSKRLLCYEIEICVFIYIYMVTKENSTDESLRTLFDKLTHYTQSSDRAFKKNVSYAYRYMRMNNFKLARKPFDMTILNPI